MSVFLRLFGKKENAKNTPIIAHETQAKWVTVYEVPTGEGWEWSEDRLEGDDFFLDSLKYVNKNYDVMTLLAKRYTIKEGHPLHTFEEYKEKDWKTYFKDLFQAEVNCDDLIEGKQTFMSDEKPAIEVQGLSNNITVKEKYSFHDRCEYIVSAIYSEEAYSNLSHEVKRWFDGIAFRV